MKRIVKELKKDNIDGTMFFNEIDSLIKENIHLFVEMVESKYKDYIIISQGEFGKLLYDGLEKNNIHNNKRLLYSRHRKNNICKVDDDEKILIIDDSCYSGKTLTDMYMLIDAIPDNIYTFVGYYGIPKNVFNNLPYIIKNTYYTCLYNYQIENGNGYLNTLTKGKI
jgi:hypothetical protein